MEYLKRWPDFWNSPEQTKAIRVSISGEFRIKIMLIERGVHPAHASQSTNDAGINWEFTQGLILGVFAGIVVAAGVLAVAYHFDLDGTRLMIQTIHRMGFSIFNA